MERSAITLRAERGQTSAEYVGMILVIAAIVAAIATSGIGATVASEIERAICSIGATSCGEASGPGSADTGAGSAPGSADGDPTGSGSPGAAVVPAGLPPVTGDEDEPRDPEGPPPSGGGPGSQAPPGGVELGPEGGRAPDPIDPPAPDAGAGEYDSQTPSLGDRLTELKWWVAAEVARRGGLFDAARHLEHFLDGSGEPLDVDVDDILDDEEVLREAVGNQVGLAVASALAAYDGTGTVDIPFRTGWVGTNLQTANWYRAMNGMNHSVTGVIRIEPGNPPQVTVTYQVHVYDRYNWDDEKFTDNGVETTPDTELQDLHLVGLAQEYDIRGTSEEITVTVDPDDPASTQPPQGGR